MFYAEFFQVAKELNFFCVSEVEIVDEKEEEEIPVEENDGPTYAHVAFTSNFIQSFLVKHPECRTLAAETNLLPQSGKLKTHLIRFSLSFRISM